MTKTDLTRAWTDEDYLLGLAADERAALPASPAGLMDLRDEDLNGVFGGSGSTNTDCSMPRIGCSGRPWCG